MTKRLTTSGMVLLLLIEICGFAQFQRAKAKGDDSRAQWQPIAAKTLFVPDTGAKEILLSLRWRSPDGTAPSVDLAFDITRTGLKLRQPSVLPRRIPPFLMPLDGTGAKILQKAASDEERGVLAGSKSSLARALLAVGILRRGSDRSTAVDVMATRTLEILAGIGIKGRVVYAWQDWQGSHAFVEIHTEDGQVLLDPTTASVVTLDGLPAGAAQVREAIEAGIPRRLGLKQVSGMPATMRPDQLLLFPPAFLRNFIVGEEVADDGAPMLSFERNLVVADLADGSLGLRVEAEPRGVWIEARSGPGQGWLEVRSTGAKVARGSGFHTLPREHFRPVRIIDMETSAQGKSIATGVEKVNAVQEAEPVPGLIGERAQRIVAGGGGVRFLFNTRKDQRYVLAAYARVLGDTLRVGIRDVMPADMTAYSYVRPADGWREIITPPFSGTDKLSVWTFSHEGPISFEVDQVVLFEIRQPTCRDEPEVVCELEISKD